MERRGGAQNCNSLRQGGTRRAAWYNLELAHDSCFEFRDGLITYDTDRPSGTSGHACSMKLDECTMNVAPTWVKDDRSNSTSITSASWLLLL